MRIDEFSKKYGVTKREVDYWTNLGYLHPETENNGYRDYNQTTEEEVKRIVILKAMGYKIDKEHIDYFMAIPHRLYYDLVFKYIEMERDKATLMYDRAMDYAHEFLKRH